MNDLSASPDPWTEVLNWLRSRAASGAKLHADSRRVQYGDIFFALPGSQSEADRYVDDALERGAAAVLLSVEGRQRRCRELDPRKPDERIYEFAQLEAVAGELAARYLGHPSRRLPVVAVTGTNGKTSVSHWIAQAWPGKAALIGTLGAGVFNDQQEPLEAFGLTTPDAVLLQQMLQDFLAQGAGLVAMEASSIGLEQGRLQGLEPAVAVFTNLSRDHLDYHPDMQAYARAKARLFGLLKPGVGNGQAVIHADDAWSQPMIEACPDGCTIWLYSIEDQPAASRALADRFRARLLWAAYTPVDDESLLQWSLFAPGEPEAVAGGALRLRLMGRFNAANALAVACALMALGQSSGQTMASLARLTPVPGRMQCFKSPCSPLVVVDYAHTPDAIAQVLDALRLVARQRQGRLHCLMGAGGDRDAGKRSAMGAAAMKGADRLCLTSDNPRYEDPSAICEALRQGAIAECADAKQADQRLFVELDREIAIDRVIRQASAEDVILIAGKGHECFQELRGHRIAFDDRVHAARGLHTHWALGAQA